MSRPPGNDRRGWTLVLVVLCAPVLALGGWAVVRAFPDPTAAGQTVEPVVVPVTTADRTATATLAVAVEPAEGTVATSAGKGTVTRAPEEGVILDDGDVALHVDDLPVRAIVAEAPLWRELHRGDRGEDVARLQEFLVATGYLDGPADGVFGSQVAYAVAEFNRDAGLPRTTYMFDPATVLWIGPQPLEVARVDAAEGAQVSPGTPVLAGPEVPGSVTVEEPAGGVDSDFAGGASLQVGDAVVPYVAGTGRVDDPDDVVAIAEALAPQTSGTAHLSADRDTQVRVVPASAIVTGADGSTCVYAEPDAEPLLVETVGGGGSSVELDVSVDIETVVANPHLVELEVPCSS